VVNLFYPSTYIKMKQLLTSSCAPANNFDNPKTEKKAALPAINNADNPTNLENDLDCSNTNVSYLLVINIKKLLYHFKFSFHTFHTHIVHITILENGISQCPHCFQLIGSVTGAY